MTSQLLCSFLHLQAFANQGASCLQHLLPMGDTLCLWERTPVFTSGITSLAFRLLRGRSPCAPANTSFPKMRLLRYLGLAWTTLSPLRETATYTFGGRVPRRGHLLPGSGIPSGSLSGLGYLPTAHQESLPLGQRRNFVCGPTLQTPRGTAALFMGARAINLKGRDPLLLTHGAG